MRTIYFTLICSIIAGILSAQFNFSGMPYNAAGQAIPENNMEKTTWIISPSKIVNTIPAPTPYIADISFDGHEIICEGYNEFQIFFLDTSNGTVVKTIPTDIKRPYGLTYDGNFIWILDNEHLIIKKVNKDDGTILSTIPISDSTSTYPTGMTIVNDNIWYNDAIGPYPSTTGDITRNIDTSGTELLAYSAFGSYPTGITFDGQHLWVSDNYEQLIHQIDITTFSVIRTIEAPGGTYPNGLAWDGKYLWVSNNDSDSLYQIDPGHSYSEIYEVACESYAMNGQIFDTSGTYTQIITNSIGFDSTITLNLTINHNSEIELFETACNNYSLNGQDYNSSGTYTQSLTGINGCDSIITLNLTIINNDTSITHTGNQLIANANNVNYQWINCYDNSFIAGENSQVFEPTINGDYAVIIEKDGCTDTSNCYNYYYVYDEKMELSDIFKVYPNPNNGEFSIKLNNIRSEITINISDVTGQTVYSEEASDREMIHISLSSSSGIYFVTVSSETSRVSTKLIIK